MPLKHHVMHFIPEYNLYNSKIAAFMKLHRMNSKAELKEMHLLFPEASKSIL